MSHWVITQNGFIFPNFRGENKTCLKPPPPSYWMFYVDIFYPLGHWMDAKKKLWRSRPSLGKQDHWKCRYGIPPFHKQNHQQAEAHECRNTKLSWPQRFWGFREPGDTWVKQVEMQPRFISPFTLPVSIVFCTIKMRRGIVTWYQMESQMRTQKNGVPSKCEGTHKSPPAHFPTCTTFLLFDTAIGRTLVVLFLFCHFLRVGVKHELWLFQLAVNRISTNSLGK